MNKQITSTEFQQILENYGSQSHVTMPVRGKDVTVLNNAMVYNPYSPKPKQYGMASDARNAENAMKFIGSEATIKSNVFQHIAGTYQIED